MSVKILTNTPTSGEFPEFYFGEHFRQTLWVEFVDNEYEKWISCFQCDYPNVLNEVLVDKENKSAFIVSGGVGYLIDIKNRELKSMVSYKMKYVSDNKKNRYKIRVKIFG